MTTLTFACAVASTTRTRTSCRCPSSAWSAGSTRSSGERRSTPTRWVPGYKRALASCRIVIHHVVVVAYLCTAKALRCMVGSDLHGAAWLVCIERSCRRQREHAQGWLQVMRLVMLCIMTCGAFMARNSAYIGGRPAAAACARHSTVEHSLAHPPSLLDPTVDPALPLKLTPTLPKP